MQAVLPAMSCENRITDTRLNRLIAVENSRDAENYFPLKTLTFPGKPSLIRQISFVNLSPTIYPSFVC